MEPSTAAADSVFLFRHPLAPVALVISQVLVLEGLKQSASFVHTASFNSSA